jgi:hypothetical protein
VYISPTFIVALLALGVNVYVPPILPLQLPPLVADELIMILAF